MLGDDNPTNLTNEIMFVDVGLMDDRNDRFWAEGSHESKPSEAEVVEAIENFAGSKYRIVEDEKSINIFKDQMMGFWRFSAIVEKR